MNAPLHDIASILVELEAVHSAFDEPVRPRYFAAMLRAHNLVHLRDRPDHFQAALGRSHRVAGSVEHKERDLNLGDDARVFLHELGGLQQFESHLKPRSIRKGERIT